MSFVTKSHLSVDMINRVSFLLRTYPSGFCDSDRSAKRLIRVLSLLSLSHKKGAGCSSKGGGASKVCTCHARDRAPIASFMGKGNYPPGGLV